jgi:hypothetical protein
MILRARRGRKSHRTRATARRRLLYQRTKRRTDMETTTHHLTVVYVIGGRR